MGTTHAKELQRITTAPTSGTQSISPRRRKSHIAEAILGGISVYLGPSTANAAVAGCCRALGREPETLELRDVPELLALLRPMLGTLLGDASGRILLHRIAKNLDS